MLLLSIKSTKIVQACMIVFQHQHISVTVEEVNTIFTEVHHVEHCCLMCNMRVV